MRKKITAQKETETKPLPEKTVRTAAEKSGAPQKKAGKPAPAVSLYSLKPPRGSLHHKKVKGRGAGSGHGKTSTRGSKGQTSRSGRDFYPGFEGGQSPLIRRMPKRGFSSKFPREYQIVNLKDLGRIQERTISPAILEESGLVKNRDKLIKILGDGEIKNPVTVQAHAFSKSAAEKITKAGGKIEIVHDKCAA
jgi:large subunit ribosomal protein L15